MYKDIETILSSHGICTVHDTVPPTDEQSFSIYIFIKVYRESEDKYIYNGVLYNTSSLNKFSNAIEELTKEGFINGKSFLAFEHRPVHVNTRIEISIGFME